MLSRIGTLYWNRMIGALGRASGKRLLVFARFDGELEVQEE